jgi:hypothetical protein
MDEKDQVINKYRELVLKYKDELVSREMKMKDKLTEIQQEYANSLK